MIKAKNYGKFVWGEYMKRPMIAAAIAAACISLILVKASFTVCVVLTIAAVLLTLVCIVFKRLRNFIAIFAVALIVLINSLFITVNKIEAVKKLDSNTPITVTGTVTKENYLDNSAFYTFKTDLSNKNVPKGINVSLYSTYASLNEGDRVECKIYVKPVPNENKTNYYSRGIYAFGTVSSVIKAERPPSLTAMLSDFRSRVTNIFFKYLSYDVAASVNAITIGDKYYLEPEFEEMVKRSGVSHIMVVSGMHMAIICGAFLKLLKFLKLGNKISAVITAVFVFLFMALCGFSMSVLRAGITYFIMLLSLFIIRRTDALNSLSVAVSVILMVNPFAASSVALQLSVLSTAGIIILSGPISKRIKSLLHIRLKFLRVIVEMISVTLSALIFTFPVTVYYFGAVSTVAVITNLLVSGAVTAVLIMSSVALPFSLVGSFSYFANGLFFFTEYITRYFNAVINYFGSLPWAYIEVDRAAIIICYLAIILSFGIIKYIENIKKVVIGYADSIRTAVKGKCQ